jgi:hypothetical protein
MRHLPGNLTSSTLTLTASLVAAFCLTAPRVAAQSDDFNDGNDAGWTRYSPLAPYGAGGTFSFPNGGYRISAPASPNQAALGPGRAGAFQAGVSYSTFRVSAEFNDWSASVSPFISVVARGRQAGLGTTDCYALAYMPNASAAVPDQGALTIQRFDNESPSGTAFSFITLDPTKTYRLVFEGDGPLLQGSIFDVAAPGSALATVSLSDATYTDGFCGILVTGSLGVTGSSAVATFDNYAATVPEPSSALLLLGGLGLLSSRRRVKRG